MRIFSLSIVGLLAVLMHLNCTSPKTMNKPAMPFDQYPVYSGKDLGVTWSPAQTVFKVWSPAAQAARLHLYHKGEGGKPRQVVPLQNSANGVWEATISGDQKGKYYTVQVNINGKWLDETPDPYAQAVGVNGHRGMIVDLSETNPTGWNTDKRPIQKAFTDIILYELHVRDFSINANSGIKNKGKFLAFTENGTKNTNGQSTGLDHLKELGITHVHLLPFFDYRYTSVDESRLKDAQYNWGYDPENYNTPEGSYSTDPYDGNVRIREFKQAVQMLHQNGIRVVMDVVYNHTGSTTKSVFNRVAPGYYYRQNADGSFSDASGCGNETASERPMVRQYIVESVKYWAKEYHIDGFRFDLMGIHDIATMNQISAELHAIDPTIYIYGEGWTSGASPLPDSLRAIKVNTSKLNQIAAFSDDFRDALKGSVFDHVDRGFVSNKSGLEESIKFGIVAATRHPQVDYSKVNYSKAPWAKEPDQTINYAECHDNHTLWDRLLLSRPEASEEDRKKMQMLALTMVLTSQGVPFLHAGAEMLRTKNGVENSFQSPDAINQIDWDRKSQYAAVGEYLRQLIQLRKNHPAFRLPSAENIRRNLKFLDTNTPNVVAYQINFNAGGDDWGKIIVIFNGNSDAQSIVLPSRQWTIVLEDYTIKESGLKTVISPKITIAGTSATILVEM